MSGRGLCRRASSSRLPPQRWRMTVVGSPGSASMQLAASGSPMRAANRAMTSLPRSVPAATTADAFMSSAARARIAASASGAKGCTASIETDCGSPNLRARASACFEASLESIKTMTVTRHRPSAASRPQRVPPPSRRRAIRRGGPGPQAPPASPAPGAVRGALACFPP